MYFYEILYNYLILTSYNDNEVMDYGTYGNQCSHLIQCEFFEALLFS